ncbi:hypothetical protein Sjap_001259 [Stephania japonica]|uniref:Uncharacterized protein n=1 Tax=Stephania japonica TaxID=461633 RepID=A0AAP0KLW8_9MAGN
MRGRDHGPPVRVPVRGRVDRGGLVANEQAVVSHGEDESSLQAFVNDAHGDVRGENEKEEEEDDEITNENDAELAKRLNKQRRQAVAATCGRRRALSARNSYKDKGSKSSQNAKIQKQMACW